MKKAWKLVERGYFTRVTLDAFARRHSFALAPSENSRRDAGSGVLAYRDIPRGRRISAIVPRSRLFTIDHGQSSRRKTFLSLGIF